MRLFVAVDLPEPARRAVAAEQRRIATALGRAATPVRWVRPEQMHLTLVFLGDVDEASVPALVGAISRDVGAPPFDIVLSGTGVFPARGAPRAVWVGVGDGALAALQKDMAERVARMGIPLEARPFHPHLTLGRWRAARLSDRVRALAAARPEAVALVRVDHATLYQSHLSPERGEGPACTALARANLTGTST